VLGVAADCQRRESGGGRGKMVGSYFEVLLKHRLQIAAQAPAAWLVEELPPLLVISVAPSLRMRIAADLLDGACSASSCR